MTSRSNLLRLVASNNQPPASFPSPRRASTMYNDVIDLPTPLARTLATWRTHMIARDLTERTITERVRFMQQVDAFVGGATGATRHDLIEFLGSNTSWANSTRAHYRSTLYAFYTWLQDEELRADNPAAKLPKVKPRRRKPTPLTHGDIVSTITSGAYYRTRVMIALHYYALMRVHEIAKVHGRDVDRQNRLLIVFGKGKKTRVVPIANELWEIVKDLPEDGYWFPNWKANKLYAAGEGHVLANSVSRLIGQAIRRGGVVGHRPHDLRASGITAQIAPGEVNILTVQDNAGHDSPATTQLYNLVTIEQKREAIELIPAVDFPQHSGRHSAA